MALIFSVPTDFLDQIGQVSSAVFSDFAPVAVIVAGISIAVFSIRFLISLAKLEKE